MNQKIKKNQAIQAVVVVLALLIFFTIWPLNLLQLQSTSKSDEVILEESGPVTVENNITQMFLAEGNYLKSVDLYVENDMTGQTITFRLYDSGYIQQWETFHVVSAKSKFPGFIHIPVGMEMEEGWEYYYTIEGLTSEMIVALEDTNASTSFANGTLLYGGNEIPGENVIIRYHYSAPFPWWLVLICGAILVFVAYQSGPFSKKLLEKKHQNIYVTVQQVFQWTCNPIVVILAIVALLAVYPFKRFEVGAVNYAFYYSGILITAAVLLFGINFKRKNDDVFLTWDLFWERLPEWLMSICFAGVIWSCAEYMNGLYDIHHMYATCKMLTWFGLAICCTMSKKDLLKIWNPIYLVLASIGAYYYAKPYAGIEEQGELYKLQAYVLVVGGFVILQLLVWTISAIKNKKNLENQWILPTTIATGILFVLLIVLRNTRISPIMTAVLFIVLYYRMWLWERSDRLMKIFGDGLIFHFLYMVGYCLMHRPYVRFLFTRYGMYYHTVTMTGYHLALVLSGILVCLLKKYQITREWKLCWKELCLLGIGHVYLFMTLSRTGLLATIVMEWFIIIFTAFVWEKKPIVEIGKRVILFALVSVILFPAVFTLQRIFPAIVDDPIYSQIEETGWEVKKNYPTNSEMYMAIDRFTKMAGNKLFGLYDDYFSKNDQEESLWPTIEFLCKAKENSVYIVNDSVLLASEESGEPEEKEDFTNGRIEIFQDYIKEWNAFGHEEMGALLRNGEIATHAHNTYLQAIHDHGLVGGIYFTLFGIFVFGYSIYSFLQKKEDYDRVLPVAVMIAFAVAGLTEWIFHICNPMGFSIFVVLVPLLLKNRTGNR